jgi:hypothetical protein
MQMVAFLTALAVIAVLLFILSFFMPDPYKELREELDRLSIEWHQDAFSIKKRLKILEEEMLIPPGFSEPERKRYNPIIVNQVRLLDKQGLPVEKIARLSSLEREDVIHILRDGKNRGELDE